MRIRGNIDIDDRMLYKRRSEDDRELGRIGRKDNINSIKRTLEEEGTKATRCCERTIDEELENGSDVIDGSLQEADIEKQERRVAEKTNNR